MLQRILMIVFVLGFSSFAIGQNKLHKQLEVTVELFRKQLEKHEKETLESLLDEKLNYGHSSGKLEDKVSFTTNLLNGNSDFVHVKFENQEIICKGSVGIVRHKLVADTNDKGIAGNIQLHVLTVWHHVDNKWILLARQAVKLPKE